MTTVTDHIRKQVTGYEKNPLHVPEPPTRLHHPRGQADQLDRSCYAMDIDPRSARSPS